MNVRQKETDCIDWKLTVVQISHTLELTVTYEVYEKRERPIEDLPFVLGDCRLRMSSQKIHVH